MKKTRRRRFAGMLDAAMCESVELVAMTPCVSIYAASAKGMALDCVCGKTATLRLTFCLLDELDQVPVDGRQRRGFDRKLEAMEEEEALAGSRNEQETEFQAHPVSQGVIAEEALPEWSECAGQSLSRVPSADAANGEWRIANGEGGTQTEAPANARAQGVMEVQKAESERRLLVEAARKPSPKEIEEREWQAAKDRQRQLAESAIAKIKAAMSRTTPYTEEERAAMDRNRAEEGPNKRALRQKLENLAEANRLEAERKAKLAAQAVPPPLRDGPEPEPVPDYAIWIRGQRAPAP